MCGLTESCRAYILLMQELGLLDATKAVAWPPLRSRLGKFSEVHHFFVLAETTTYSGGGGGSSGYLAGTCRRSAGVYWRGGGGGQAFFRVLCWREGKWAGQENKWSRVLCGDGGSKEWVNM